MIRPLTAISAFSTTVDRAACLGRASEVVATQQP